MENNITGDGQERCEGGCELEEAEKLVEMEVECRIRRRIELVRSSRRRVIGNRSERGQKEE